MSELKKLTTKKESEIVKKILDGRRNWESYYNENNDNFDDDVRFLYESQLTAKELSAYKADNRVALQANLLVKIVDQLHGEFASNVFSHKVRAATRMSAESMGIQDAIDVRDNILTHVEFLSGSTPRTMAFENMTSGGYGVIRLAVVRDENDIFQQTIKMLGVHYPPLCYFDPNARDEEKYKQDGKYCGVHTLLGKDEFKKLYPTVNVDGRCQDIGRSYEWITPDGVWVIDHWQKESIKRMVARVVSDNNVISTMDLTKEEEQEVNESDMKETVNGNISKPPSFMRNGKRFFVIDKMIDDKAFEIHFYRASCNKVLEHTIWQSKYLPLFYFPCRNKWVIDKEITLSVTHFAKDMQRFHNFIINEIAERFKLTRYEPYLATPAMIKNHEPMWNNVSQPKTWLPFNIEQSPSGQPMVPIRQTPQEVPQSLFLQQQQSAAAIQAVTGRFDANFGAQGNEMSGVGIAQRQFGGNITTKIIFENFRKAYEIVLNGILDIVPSIFDNTRELDLSENEDSTRFLKVNDPTNDSTNLALGKFGVKVSVGNNYELQKMQNLAFLERLTSAYPALIPVTIDLLLENADLPNTPQLVQRVRNSGIVNPEIILQESSNPKEIQMAQKNIKTKQEDKQLMMQMAERKQQNEQQIVQNDTVRAHSGQINAIGSSTAKLQDSQTERLNVLMKGSVESEKLKVEQARTDAELQEAAFKVAKEISAAPQIKESQTF